MAPKRRNVINLINRVNEEAEEQSDAGNDKTAQSEEMSASTESSRGLLEFAYELLGTLQDQQRLQKASQDQVDQLLSQKATQGAGEQGEYQGDMKDFKSLKPASFSGTIDPTEAQEWILSMEKTFRVFKCSEEEKVQFAAFQLQGKAYDWWLSEEGLLKGLNEVITWEKFKEVFNKKYFPKSLRDRLMEEFLALKQGDKMTVSDYQDKFERLCKFAPQMIASEVDKVARFESGLEPNIKQMVKPFELQTYAAVVEKAKIVEMSIAEVRDDRSEKMKKRHGSQSFQSFGGGFKRQNTQFSDFRSSIPSGSRLPFSQGSKITGKPQMSRSVTPSSRSGNLSQQNFVGTRCPRCSRFYKGDECRWCQGLCFKCGKKGHRIADCPEEKEGSSRTPQQFQATTIGKPLVPATQSRSGNQKPRAPGRVFALTKNEAQMSNAVVTGTLPISDIYGYVLFDPGATHSFMSYIFAQKYGLSCEPMEVELYVDTPAGEVLATDMICKACIVKIENTELPADLILLDMKDFDVILGMDWLSTYHANLDCRNKTVELHLPGQPAFKFVGSQGRLPPRVISSLKARRLIEKW